MRAAQCAKRTPFAKGNQIFRETSTALVKGQRKGVFFRGSLHLTMLLQTKSKVVVHLTLLTPRPDRFARAFPLRGSRDPVRSRITYSSLRAGLSGGDARRRRRADSLRIALQRLRLGRHPNPQRDNSLLTIYWFEFTLSSR